MLKAECLVKGFHNVRSHKSTRYLFQGVSLTPAAVASLLIPPKNESVFSHCTFQIHSGLFSRGLTMVWSKWHEVTVLFLPMILGKRNTSLCLVIINQSGTCTHTEQSRPSSAEVLRAPITVLFGPLMTLPNHSLKIFFRAEGYFTFLLIKEVLFYRYK